MHWLTPKRLFRATRCWPASWMSATLHRWKPWLPRWRSVLAPHFVFNNAGVGCGGLIWENPLADWQWVLDVNLMGVVHGVRLFTP